MYIVKKLALKVSWFYLKYTRRYKARNFHAHLLNEYAKEEEEQKEEEEEEKKTTHWPTFHWALLRKSGEYLFSISLI